jgi:TonB family protein
MNIRVCLCVVLKMFALGGVSAPARSAADEGDAGIAIQQTSLLVYPPMMLYNAVYYGEARVAISVDQDGKLTDYLVTGYTNPVFAEASVAALKRWSYEAARAKGKVRASRADVLFIFRDRGVIVQNLPGALEQYRAFGNTQDRYTFKPCKLRELDRIPDPVHVVAPIAAKSSLLHSVTVEFYIDEEGKVRMPAVARESVDDEYAAAAVAAVEQWRFEPPLRKGRPVLVYAQQEFDFRP